MPRLRDDLRWTFQEIGGEGGYLLEDLLKGRFYRLGLREYRFVKSLDGRRTIAEIVADLASSRFHQLVYASLVARDAQLRPIPDLAASWDRPDDLTFVFHLREGLTFHDGSPLTSKDVVYSLLTTADPALGSPRAADMDRIATVEATDATTVTIKKPARTT